MPLETRSGIFMYSATKASTACLYRGSLEGGGDMGLLAVVLLDHMDEKDVDVVVAVVGALRCVDILSMLCSDHDVVIGLGTFAALKAATVVLAAGGDPSALVLSPSSLVVVVVAADWGEETEEKLVSGEGIDDIVVGVGVLLLLGFFVVAGDIARRRHGTLES
ncbi:hypothetical protein GGI21_001449 [Coemansia aciculifera]|nr:hypothetical protein GGI21_001449 [Coemansia aciculifera]